MKPVARFSRKLCLLALFLSCSLSGMAQSATEVVVVGTGTPVLDKDRVGASIAVIVNGQAYLFDVGAGAVHRLFEGSQSLQLPALSPVAICCLFFTHLHSDHTEDFSELVNATWWDRKDPLQAFGPVGLNRLTEALRSMQSVDQEIRLQSNQPIANRNLPKVVSAEIESGIVFENADIRIEAFLVNHGDISLAYGYHIDTADLSIVISSDTAFSETLIEKAKGVDLLFHEVASRTGLNALPPAWQTYHWEAHTTTDELARVANLAKPKHLVLYHLLFFGVTPEELLKEVTENYQGKVSVASDLDRF